MDAGAARELMACLVKLQSSLSEVNEYVHYATLKIFISEIVRASLMVTSSCDNTILARKGEC